MNIALFTEDDFLHALPLGDERVRHVLRVLKKGPGDEFKAGIENGRLGMARIESLDDSGMRLSFRALGDPPPLRRLCLLLGFPRPIQANRILKDLTSLGVRRILLSATELGEKSYTQGTFFSSGGWERAIREGASQAGSPLLPSVSRHESLEDALIAVRDEPGIKAALDPKEAECPLRSLPFQADSGAVLAIGSERGWTNAERDLLRSRGFRLAGLGDRILRTETAAVAAVSVCLAAMEAI
jgi:16S rRNA (uracil1498-N3)-methyltransferase